MLQSGDVATMIFQGAMVGVFAIFVLHLRRVDSEIESDVRESNQAIITNLIQLLKDVSEEKALIRRQIERNTEALYMIAEVINGESGPRLRRTIRGKYSDAERS